MTVKAATTSTTTGLACAISALCVASPALAQRPQVTIAQGSLSGVEADGVEAFKGIPFAAPPVGALRWRAPQPAPAWQGLRDASDYGHDCVQNYTGFQPKGSEPAEDCLYLNIWRPHGVKQKLPVLVWIYGGGFVNGSASRPIYQGHRLASRNILVVNLNYRLGRFGTFAHPALTKADEDQGKLGNYGYLDQIAALQWVQRNIAAFGGDPANVTIFGESAGGMSVHNLLTSPLAKGLFKRAAIASGGDGHFIGTPTLAAAEAIGVDFGQSQNIAGDDPQALAKLRALPADALRGDIKLGSVLANGKRSFSSPFPDGKITVDTLPAYTSGQFRHVPVMIGATSGDMGGPSGMMIKGARDLAALLSSSDVPTYYYRFSYVADAAPTGKQAGAIHADDLPYYFDTADIKYDKDTKPADRKMGLITSSYLVHFVKTGNPNGAGLPKWPRYQGKGGMMMDLSASGRAEAKREPISAQEPAPAAKSAPISPSAS
ncbi:carboxylesterase [Novosphingobium umbonatum]|uniref:Carboxylic ester hydrolase n=1 Tax=Novosphingobium umbonatum TaxID=1908524 RepID=A0A3S3TPT8_9SPHN|nr:carboxylesterase family protein [Novosphingobium umbonatum]RVU05836.1 carboxylesterase [Novosphingobium umbonatum]